MKPLQVTSDFTWSLGATATYDVGVPLAFTLTLVGPSAGTFYVVGQLMDADGVPIPGTEFNLFDVAGVLTDSAANITTWTLALDESTGALTCQLSALAYTDVGLYLYMYEMLGAIPAPATDTLIGTLSTILMATPAADTGFSETLSAFLPILMLGMMVGMMSPMLKGMK